MVLWLQNLEFVNNDGAHCELSKMILLIFDTNISSIIFDYVEDKL